MLWRTLKMAIWVSYDHLGRLLAANLFCMLALVAPAGLGYAALASGDAGLALMLGLPMGLLAIGVLGPVLGAGLANMVKELIDTREGSFRSFFAGMLHFGVRAAGIGLAFVAAWSCLAASIWFYAGRVGAEAPYVGYGLGAAVGWSLVFAVLAGMFALPALVQKNGGVWATVKLSGLLVLDNPLFAAGLAVHCLLLGMLSMMPPVLALFSMAPLVVLVSCGYEILARKYAWRSSPEERAWDPVKAYGDETDDYLNRGFRDFLFPWKG